MSYFSVVTNIGKSKIANALQSGTAVNITKLYVSETDLIPNAEMTEPIDKIWEGNLQKYTVEENIISASSVIPADIGTFTVRSMGLIDSDGDLFAIANVPATLKSNERNVSAVLELTISIKLENTNTVHFEIIGDYDTALDENSANAVQNKVVAKEINKLTDEINSIGLVYDPEMQGIKIALTGGGSTSGGGGSSGGSSEYVLPVATTSRLGGVKIGKGLSVTNDGVISPNYSDLPTATPEEINALFEEGGD